MKKNPYDYASAILTGVAAVLILRGWFVPAESIAHQCYAAIQYCTGFLLLGIAMVVEGLAALIKKSTS